ncbi:LolA family protein [Streptomyces sp. enrichment culture]|uniref:LolA family protein n=1 Tax=Streptomyces sp. enrichment culture TaxID=1795815 RepID=UPI003F564BED
MAPNDSDAQTPRPARRTLARYAVPVAVAGVAAATIGLVPALAAAGDPDLPKITAQELVEKIAASDVQQLSGTVKVTTDLGLPSIAGLGDLMGGDAAAKSADAQLMRLASGTHTLKVAADGPDRQRLTVQDGDGEYTLVRNGDQAWAYDSASGEVHHEKGLGTAPEDRDGHGRGTGGDDLPVTPKELAAQALAAVDGTTSVTVEGSARVAGRDAYQLVVRPEQSGSTIGAVKVAVDAENGVPLKFTLTPSAGGAAAVDVGFTKVDFGKPAASEFTFTPPKGAKVVEGEGAGDEGPAAGLKEKDRKALEQELGGLEDLAGGAGGQGVNVIGEGWTTVVELAGPGAPADAPKGKPQGAKPEAGATPEELPKEAQQFLDGLGTRVSGEFGSGMVFKTRLVNALMTDDGRVYVGAVTEKALVAAANDTSE